ncbi:class I SAM-dependent methyltransferase [Streptomyces sp. NPDC057623]|uniref:class I SAM-dependent methyltransferase n=1 Tax=Streptomyces sp. NPDC057623 TaxID=3346187 RepID=UPI0036C6423F
MTRDRGLAHARKYLGDFEAAVAARIEQQGRVRLLEAGCGYGVAMMELVRTFGDAVEVCGFNYSPIDGDEQRMRAEALERGIFIAQDLERTALPHITYCDASRPLPFPDASFDFVYSQASLYLYDDKAAFLKECNRLLAPGGLARINPSLHFDEKDAPEKYQGYWEIWDRGREVELGDHLRSVDGIELVWPAGREHPDLAYLELRRQDHLDLGLRLVASVDLNFLWHEWGGVRSVYSTQVDFTPRYKREQARPATAGLTP